MERRCHGALSPLDIEEHSDYEFANLGYLRKQAVVQCTWWRQGVLSIPSCCWDGGVPGAATAPLSPAQRGNALCFWRAELDSLFLWEYEANTHLGRWLGAGGISIPSISLEESEENLKGPDKQLFLEFLRSMLQWVPGERKAAKELDDPGLNST